MPTGYTAGIADGSITEFEPFIWQLARGMGALVTMRDEAHDAPIPEAFEPSKYFADRLAEATAERDRLYAMTDAEAQAEADRGRADYEAGEAAAKADHAARRARYQAMIAKTEAWTGAPEGIKDFALEQLRQSIDFDCREPFKYYRDAPPASGTEWKAAKLEKVARDIERHAAEDAKERARTDSRNAWLAQLRRSLAVSAQNGGAA